MTAGRSRPNGGLQPTGAQSDSGPRALKSTGELADTSEVTGLMGWPTGAATAIEAPKLGLGGTPTLVFQPAVDLATGRLLGFEALLRCHDASGGNIPPDVLIPWQRPTDT